MDDWKLLVAMDAQSEPYELGLGDPGFVPKLSRPDGFEPQMWGSLPWGFGRFNSYVLPGIYGEVA